MIRCSNCVMPDSRPDVPFTDGVCAACLTYAKRPMIDWDERKAELLALLDRHNGRVIVPSSAGKDSTYQAITLKEMGADVTCVTARTCHLTPVGRRNIDNLARHCRTVEYTPNMRVRGKLNKLGLKLVGDISHPEHMAIFTTPFRAAVDLGIPLIMYGENPQNQYGGPHGTEEAREMTLRWRSEFGGFLGLRPADLIGQDGITERDMADYMPPSAKELSDAKVEAHFLGQYIPWDSHQNAEVALKAGMRTVHVSDANWWEFENLDGAQCSIHDAGMFRKYGYGRGCAQISVDIRAGRVSRDIALNWVKKHDGILPEIYAGVTLEEVLVNIDLGRKELFDTLDQFTNWSLFNGQESGRLILKEFA